MLYKNILFIDDDIDDTEIFKAALDVICSEIQMESALNPKLALEELKTRVSLPDLIFLDFNMPMLNGLEVLQELKNDSRLCDIPVILISTPSEQMMKEQLEANEVLNYIGKPNNFNELVTILKETMKYL